MRTWWLPCVLAALLVAGCAPPEDDTPLSEKDLRDSKYATKATTGVAALGRKFTSVDEMVTWYDKIATCKKSDVKKADANAIRFYLAAEMVPLVGDVGICSQGFGDVLGFVKPGKMPAFQTAYKRDLQRDPALWHRKSHRLALGNGFFLMNRSGSGVETYGGRYLRCDQAAEISFPKEEFKADIPGCLLLRKAYGDDE
jgi:hypothetical protein